MRMDTEIQDIVPSQENSEELITTEKKVEYSVKSEVISTVKTHETVTYVTEVHTETETVENHVQETVEGTTEEVKAIENGDTEEEGEKQDEEEKPKENGESEHAEDVPAEEGSKIEATEDEVVEAAGPTEVVEAAPEVEEEAPKVILHQLPPVKEIVSRSPQCLALETFLKMAKIPYANEYEDKAQDVTKETKGKIPYIEYKKKKVEGLKNCLNFLKEEFAVDTDKHLTPKEEAIAYAFRTMIEESTNWSLVYYRWVDNYGESKKMFSKLPPVLNVVSPKMFQNKCKKSIESHVIGRHNREELYNIAEQDLSSLSAFLEGKEYFMGDRPVSFDAIVFGLLANFDYGTVNSPQQTLIREKLSNLHAFCERMKEKFWEDWLDICGADKFQEKPKTSLVKRLSFRSNKKNRKPKEEGEKSEPTSPSEEKPGEKNNKGEEPKENGETKENGEAHDENGEAKENGEQKENGEAAEEEKDEEKKEENKEDETTEEKKEDKVEDGEGETVAHTD